MSFGSRFRERREALGLRQSDLGKLLGVTGAAIANYENGVSSPKADVLYRLFDALECDANYLFQDEMSDQKETSVAIICETAEESELVRLFRALNDLGRNTLMSTARAFAGNPDMQKEKPSVETA